MKKGEERVPPSSDDARIADRAKRLAAASVYPRAGIQVRITNLPLEIQGALHPGEVGGHASVRFRAHLSDAPLQ
jgi:hypothetical protein